MLETHNHVPAFILGRRTDVLASNRLAREVLTDFDALPANQRNLARYYLLDPQARERVGDWELVTTPHAPADLIGCRRTRPGAKPHRHLLSP